jgi:hypothetical protein
MSAAFATPTVAGSTHHRISKPKAETIARKAALARGIRLSEYQRSYLSTMPDRDRDGWLINFRCHPQPAPPGCGFFVHVNWNTGQASLLMGQ